MPDFKYPLPKFHFELEWGGTRLGFTEVTGLDFETEVIEYREGNLPAYNKTKQPGLTKYTDVTLKRGIILDDLEYFNQWVKTAMFQEIKEKYRRTVTIKLLNEEHKAIIVWTLSRAWPSKIQSTDLKADGNEVAIETLTFVHEGLVMAKP
ncbi:MAG: phage tail protein [Ginsengibacter sp.]|jgi:phage tail-like protein